MIFPQKLIEAIEKNKLIIWVGSGYSQSLGFPKWDNFISLIAEAAFNDDPVSLEKFQKDHTENQKKANPNKFLQLNFWSSYPHIKVKFFGYSPICFGYPTKRMQTLHGFHSREYGR